ncbi:MAG: TIM barrel protein [Nanoarchaeota archaeon]
MIFNNDYANPMDRDYSFTLPSNDMPYEPEFEQSGAPTPGLSVKDVGMSVPLGIAAGNPWGIQAKIRSGVNAVEIGFPGVFHGQRNAHTPEMYGKEARQAIKEIGKAADVNFTTHAAYGLMGMSGVDQQGNFSWDHQKMAVDEIRKAIDFAADTTPGGSVVVHTGEFERPMSEQPWSWDEGGKLLFRQRLYEPQDAVFKVLDDRTGQVMSTVAKDRLVARSVWNTAAQDHEGIDQKGRSTHIRQGDFVDYEGRKVLDPYDAKHGRVPKFNKSTGRFEVEMWHFDDFVKEAQERNRHKQQQSGRMLTPREMILPEELYLQATLETQEGHSRGWALQYAQGFNKNLDLLNRLEDMKKYYERISKNVPQNEQWKLFQTDDMLYRMSQGVIPPESKHPLELIDKQIQETRRSVEFEHQASNSQEQQASETAETRKHIIAPVKRMWEAGLRGYAEAGIHALQQSKNTEKPIFISMENIFPERYGGHPQEFKQLIFGAREKMVELLTQKEVKSEKWNSDKHAYEPSSFPNPYFKNISKEEAAKLAERHIKATFDTAHMNLWRKYWQHDPAKTPEQNDKGFEKWYLREFEDLAKSGVIGNMHLVDNFGYSDEHLAPGQGNTPVKAVTEILKKYGYGGAYTVEPGADASVDQGDVYGMMKAWRHFGSGVYGASGGAPAMGAPGGGNWTNVQYSYFGQDAKPYFIFGSYAPSNDWTLWSQVPLE